MSLLATLTLLLSWTWEGTPVFQCSKTVSCVEINYRMPSLTIGVNGPVLSVWHNGRRLIPGLQWNISNMGGYNTVFIRVNKPDTSVSQFRVHTSEISIFTSPVF